MIKIAHSDLYNHPLPEGHRFPMLKYDLIPEQLLHNGEISRDQLFVPQDVDGEILTLTHTAEYLEKLKKGNVSRHEERRFGFPWSERLLAREINICSGTLQCGQFALKHGAALNVAGGTHHAFADRGEGFCILNDIAIATNYLLKTGQVKSVLCVDLDVHQGNGTASIFAGNSQVFTFSMHGANNFPFSKEQSDADVALPDGFDETSYLETLNFYLDEVWDIAMPDIVFFQSGVDILECDKLGKLKISVEGIRERDKMVFQKSSKAGVPVVAVMGGGYSENLSKIVEAHCNTFKIAIDCYQKV